MDNSKARHKDVIPGLAKRLEALRTNEHDSQKETAEKLHVSPSIISGYENEYRSPSLKTILAYAYAYHTTTDYILGKDNSTPPAVLDVTGLTPEQIQALRVLIESLKKA